MIISNVHIMGEEGVKDIGIDNGIITSVTANKTVLPLSINMPRDCIAFPGLINSHDHLDFNLFPQLGNRIYKNYKEWGDDINDNNIGQIKEVLKIPQELRTQWGIYKNLLNGVTTVVNHGKKLTVDDELITVFQDCYSLHSLEYEKNWKWKLNDPFKKNKPFVIHIGEGTDEAAGKEIDALIKANIFKKKIIAVHGIAMKASQANAFSALVWCPVANLFLLGSTAGVEKLKNSTAVIIGTDSTLSAGWNIWEQLRMARKQNCLTDNELVNAVTSTAASVWNLNAGVIAENKVADIVIAKKKPWLNEMDNFFELNPDDILLVINKGSIGLFDEVLIDHVKNCVANDFKPVNIKGVTKYVRGDLRALGQSIKEIYPQTQFPFS